MKREHDGLEAAAAGLGHAAPEHPLVAAVDAVEVSDHGQCAIRVRGQPFGSVDAALVHGFTQGRSYYKAERLASLARPAQKLT